MRARDGDPTWNTQYRQTQPYGGGQVDSGMTCVRSTDEQVLARQLHAPASPSRKQHTGLGKLQTADPSDLNVGKQVHTTAVSGTPSTHNQLLCALPLLLPAAASTTSYVDCPQQVSDHSEIAHHVFIISGERTPSSLIDETSCRRSVPVVSQDSVHPEWKRKWPTGQGVVSASRMLGMALPPHWWLSPSPCTAKTA
jgi:hypothetical protein